jgi:hypothetical protein
VIESFVLAVEARTGHLPQDDGEVRKHMTVEDMKIGLEESRSALLCEPEWPVIPAFQLHTLLPEVRGD